MRIKLNLNRSANIGIQTIFFIMMSLLMVWIIVFGIQKLFMVDDQLSEQDRIDVQNQIEDAFKYCEDPLNKGNMKVLEFNNKLFNSICVLGDDINTGNTELTTELSTINQSGHNIVLLKTTFTNENLKDYKIISTFNSKIKSSGCNFDKNNTGKLRFELTCN